MSTEPTPGPDSGAETPKLSVIISCRNSGSTLAETLEAVIVQDYPGWWELVVVDNGSSDDTAAVARRVGTKAPNFSLLQPPKPGYQAYGLNYGIAHSRGDYLVFLDGDDLAAPGYLEEMAKALDSAPFVGGAMDVERLNPEWLRARRRELQVDRIDRFCDYLPAVIGASMSGRRAPIEAVGGFDESLPTQHDLDISWRLHEAGYPGTFVPKAVLHYRYRPSLKAIFDQELGYGEGEVVLYKKFRDRGLKRRSLAHVLVGYARMLHALGDIRTIEGKARFLTLAGANLGRLKGSIMSRTLFL